MTNFKKLENLLINFGPQHPAAHGVLRLVLELKGEALAKADPHIGLLHRGTEKLLENKTFLQGLPYVDRLDYVSMMAQEYNFANLIEFLLGSQVSPRILFIRALCLEITRILNHLLALTTHALDVGAMTPFLWAFEEREKLMEFYERLSGARLHANFIRPGGLASDLNNHTLTDLYYFLLNFSTHILEIENILHFNRIWRQRLVDIGTVAAKTAFNWGFSGVMLRASGIKWDLRRNSGFSSVYSNLDFNIPVGKKGDCFDRYLLRVEEMKQSIRLLKQIIQYLPSGDSWVNDFKIIAPSRSQMKVSMESLIHHFKLYTEGFHVFHSKSYQSLEAPKGEFGLFLVADNSNCPYRLHIRAPGYFHLQSLNEMTKDSLVADLVAIIGTQDLVFGEIDR